MNSIKKIIAQNELVRLDKLHFAEDISRSQLSRYIEEGRLLLNGVAVTKPSFIPKAGDLAELLIPALKEPDVLPEDIDIAIIYEDDDIAAVVKPAGMVVHPAPGHTSGTLVSALLHRLQNLSGIGGQKRPGIVHRLDKDTSGLLLVAKNDRAHISLSNQLKARSMEKHYYAMVSGHMKEEEGHIENYIARSPKDRKKMAVQKEGRLAISKWKCLKTYPQKSLLDVQIITGRTHQIRVHMAHIGHPILGDSIYGGKSGKNAARLLLQAYSLCFLHPRTNEALCFTIPMEDCFL